MNSSMRHITNVIIDSSIITLSSVNICVSTGMFTFIVYDLTKIKNSPHRVALLLTANVYLALLCFSILCLEQYVHVLLEHLYLSISTNYGIYCQIRAYLQWVGLSAICYSNTLQAVYRLCRIVFYRKQSLQSFHLYQTLIIIQWMICFLIMISALLLNDFKYSNDDYYCQIDYSNLRSTLSRGTLAYGIPMTTTIGCYIYTVKKMPRGNNSLMRKMTRIEQMIARRDLIVLFRICLLVGLLMIMSIPSVISLIISHFTGSLPWWSAPVQWMVLILSIISVTISLALISPHIRNLWRKVFDHHPRPAIALANIRIN